MLEPAELSNTSVADTDKIAAAKIPGFFVSIRASTW
jgi:hypothetical protein